jgi:hypothetical protein
LNKSVYLREKMNARALKHYIWEHLRKRKFEFESLMHNYHQTIGHMHLTLREKDSVVVQVH